MCREQGRVSRSQPCPPLQRTRAPVTRFPGHTYAHTVSHTATKFCVVIKLDKKFYSVDHASEFCRHPLVHAQTPFDVELRAKIAVVTLRSKLKQPLPSAAGFNLVKHCPILIFLADIFLEQVGLKWSLISRVERRDLFAVANLQFTVAYCVAK